MAAGVWALAHTRRHLQSRSQSPPERSTRANQSDIVNMTVEEAERSSPHERWRLTEGLQLLGPVQGSGLRDPSYLVRRNDGQVVQVSELLQLVMSEVDPTRHVDEICATVSDACGRTLTRE